MRAPVLLAVVVSFAVPAWAQADAVPRLGVHRADADSTGINAFQLDAALRPAFAAEAMNETSSFVLVPDYEAEVVVSVRGDAREAGYRVTFRLVVADQPALHDTVEVDRNAPEVGPHTARVMARTVGLHARALLEQASLSPAPGVAPRDDAPGAADEAPRTAFRPKEPPPRTWGRLDVMVQGGLTTPAGFIGARLGVNPFGYVGLTVAGGYSSWGPRVSPGLRVYPFGLDLLGLYVEIDAMVSLGEGATVTRAGQAVAVQLKSTLSLAPVMGFRQQVWKWLSADLFLGWAFPFANGNVVRDDGAPVDRALLDALEGRQPGGLVAGVALGASLF